MRIFRKRIEKLIKAFRRDIFVEHIVAQRRRGGAAGAEAFILNEGELAIGGGFTGFDVQLFLEVLGDIA